MRGTHSQIVMMTWLTTAMAAVAAVAATCTPERWSLDITRVRQGEWWRLASGHLVHLSPQHLLLDLLAFGLALALCSRLTGRPSEVATTFLASTMTVSTILMVAQPVDVYGGLSGITAGLIAWAALRLISSGAPTAGVLLLVGIVSKILLEHRGMSASGVFPVWQAHAAGAAAGMLVAIVSQLRQLEHQPSFMGRRAP